MILPLGFPFFPSDEELISSYLLKRVMGLPLPCHVILERNLYGQNTVPCDVFGDIDESNSWYWQSEHHETKVVTKLVKTIYVFTKLVKAGSNSSRIARRAGSGTWSGQTGARIIKNFNGETIGSRKMFTFEDSTADKGGYHWIMHEYSLDGVYKNLGPNNDNNDIVLCKITRSFKGKPTTGGSRLDHTQQPVATMENNGSRLDHTPQPVGTVENNGDLLDQIAQLPVATIEDNEDGYIVPGSCINGGFIDHIRQSAASVENNGVEYHFFSACNYGGDMDQIPQSPATIENNIEASTWSLMSGQKRSWDEGTGVPLLEDCEGQINPKKPSISSSSSYDDDNYATFLEEQIWADLESNDADYLFEGLPDIESLDWLVDYETNVV